MRTGKCLIKSAFPFPGRTHEWTGEHEWLPFEDSPVYYLSFPAATENGVSICRLMSPYTRRRVSSPLRVCQIHTSSSSPFRAYEHLGTYKDCAICGNMYGERKGLTFRPQSKNGAERIHDVLTKKVSFSFFSGEKYLLLGVCIPILFFLYFFSSVGAFHFLGTKSLIKIHKKGGLAAVGWEICTSYDTRSCKKWKRIHFALSHGNRNEVSSAFQVSLLYMRAHFEMLSRKTK